MTQIAGWKTLQQRAFKMNPDLLRYRELATPDNNWHDSLGFHATHALERCKERYGFAITAQDWERMNWDIWRDINGAEFMFVKNEDTSVYKVQFTPIRGRKRTFYVYYSERFYCVTTFLPAGDRRLQPDFDAEERFSPYCQKRMAYRWAFKNGREPEDVNPSLSPVSPAQVGKVTAHRQKLHAMKRKFKASVPPQNVPSRPILSQADIRKALLK